MTHSETGSKRKSMLIDNNTEASLSALVKCNVLKYAFHYPILPILFLISQISAYYFFMMASSSLTVAGVVTFVLIFMYWKHVRAVCWNGDLCAGKVVSVCPLRIAVYTDLSHSTDFSQYREPFPVIKIMKPPLMTFGNRKPEVGDRLATVTMYHASEEYQERWENFSPRPVRCLTFNKLQIKRTIERIPQELWDELDSNLELIYGRTETIGLYHHEKMIG